MALTAEEKEYIKQSESMIDGIMSCLNAVKQFNKGDYLIAFHQDRGWGGEDGSRPVTNSYGAAKKFQVVAVDKHGVPYMKELNKQGKPTGQMICSIKYEKQNRTHIDTVLTYRFEVDPDYTDAIILDDQGNYNASNILKLKSDTFKEIAEHNKKIKVEANDAKLLAAFIATVKVGDLLWRSNVSSWVVVEINPFQEIKQIELKTTLHLQRLQPTRARLFHYVSTISVDELSTLQDLGPIKNYEIRNDISLGGIAHVTSKQYEFTGENWR